MASSILRGLICASNEFEAVKSVNSPTLIKPATKDKKGTFKFLYSTRRIEYSNNNCGFHIFYDIARICENVLESFNQNI